MVTPIVNPTSANYGAIAPGATGGGLIYIDKAPSDSLITAKIVSGSSVFSVGSVTTWEWQWETVDPDELPPRHKGPLPKHRVLEQVGQSDGVTPLAVSVGQTVKIGIYATMPSEIPISGGEYTGALLLHGEGWDDVQVSLLAVLAHVKSSLGANAITIAQGDTAKLPISSQSIAGPDTFVQFFLHDGPESAGVTMAPASIFLPSGQFSSTSLLISVAPDAEAGDRILFFSESAFNGAQHDAVVPGAKLTIVNGKIFVSSPDSALGLIAPRGGSVNVEFDVTLQGNATDIYFSGNNLPKGVSVSPQSLHVGAGGTGKIFLVVNVDPNLQAGPTSPINIGWSAYGGTQSGNFVFSLIVFSPPVPRVLRVGILRYEWQTPKPSAKTEFLKWDDWVFQEIFMNPNGWSISDYWSRSTLGLMALNFDLMPWRTLPLIEAGQENDRQKAIDLIKNQARTDGVQLGNYDQIIAFIQPPPSNAGATNSPGDALLDEDGALFFYQHELGHVQGFQHAWGPTSDGNYAAYHDDYCVMGFSKDQSHPIQASSKFANIQLNSDFWVSERRLSAAALYRYLPAFASSSAVVRVNAEQKTDVTLTGLCWAHPQSSILAVISTKQGEITVEYRPNVGDDAGVFPAVVIHSIGRRSLPSGAGEVRPIFYEGKIPTNDSGSFTTLEGDVVVLFDASTKVGRNITVRISA